MDSGKSVARKLTETLWTVSKRQNSRPGASIFSIGSLEFLSAAAKALRSPMGNRQVMSLGVSGFSALGQRCLYALSAQQHVVIPPCLRRWPAYVANVASRRISAG